MPIKSPHITLLFLVLLGLKSHGQVVRFDDLTYSFKGGILMAHRPSMNHLVQKNAWAHELCLVKKIRNDDTRRIFGDPRHGLSFEARNFGNNDVLGHAFSISFFNQMNLLTTKKNFFLNLKLTTGLGYLTKTYDEVNNPKNNAIGSHLNPKVTLLVSARQYLNQKFYVDFGIEFNHFSNGSIVTPNLGLNSPSLMLGIGKEINEYNYNSTLNFEMVDSITPKKLSHEFYATLIGSIKEIGEVPYHAKRYGVGALKLGYGIQPFHKWSFETGIDLVYNDANLHKYDDSTFTAKDVPQIGVFLGFGLHFNNSVIAMNYGYYLLDKIDAEGVLYNRVGYRYYFWKNWYSTFAIKANFARADYFEFGIGYAVKR